LYFSKTTIFKTLVALGKKSLPLSNGHDYKLQGWKNVAKPLPKLKVTNILL